jgi:hypothetical protein
MSDASITYARAPLAALLQRVSAWHDPFVVRLSSFAAAEVQLRPPWSSSSLRADRARGRLLCAAPGCRPTPGARLTSFSSRRLGKGGKGGKHQRHGAPASGGGRH